MNMNRIKLLVITNNPLTKNNSNGRTVLNMVKNKSIEIINFFINGETSNLEDDIVYYRFTDKDALKSLINKDIKPVVVQRTNFQASQSHKTKKRKKRTPFKTLLRNKVWSRKTIKKDVSLIVKTINPDILLFQLGDSTFLNEIVASVVYETKLKLITFNSEDYYFKKWNYLTKKKSLIFKIIKKQFDKSFEKIMELSCFDIYLTEDLENIYKRRFISKNSGVIYNTSSLINEPTNFSIDETLFVYSGNLGVGRLDSLLEIADVLHSLDSSYKLTIFSLSNEERIKTILNNNISVVFKGGVSYERNIEILKKARIVFCAEGMDDFYVKDTCHAFSTKIADLLALEKLVVVYAPKTTSIYKYFDENGIGFTAYDRSSLCNSIKQAIECGCKNPFIAQQTHIFKKNHNLESNSNRFLSIVKNVLLNK